MPGLASKGKPDRQRRRACVWQAGSQVRSLSGARFVPSLPSLASISLPSRFLNFIFSYLGSCIRGKEKEGSARKNSRTQTLLSGKKRHANRVPCYPSQFLSRIFFHCKKGRKVNSCFGKKQEKPVNSRYRQQQQFFSANLIFV